MRRLVAAVLFAGILLAPPSAAAKEGDVTAVEACGATGCVRLSELTILQILTTFVRDGADGSASPPPPGPFYVLRYLGKGGHPLGSRFYFVPSPDSANGRTRFERDRAWAVLDRFTSELLYWHVERRVAPFPLTAWRRIARGRR
jgi:hypothetical protein